MNSINRISTSTNMLCFRRNEERRKMVEIVPLLAIAGYKYIDLNFCELLNPNNDIDDKYISKLDSYREEFGIVYNQCHVPYTNYYNKLNSEEQKQNDDLIIRAFDYASTLGVDTVVIHPIRGSIDDNKAYFEKMLKYFPSNMRLAIENMESIEELSTAEELLTLLSKLNRKNVGICLDTGHAYMRGLDLKETIKKLGNNLIATHIADNHGKSDEHFMPFFGSIDWESVMSALREINYEGFLTYEIMFFFRYIPADLQMDMLTYSLKVASKLYSFFQDGSK